MVHDTNNLLQQVQSFRIATCLVDCACVFEVLSVEICSVDYSD